MLYSVKNDDLINIPSQNGSLLVPKRPLSPVEVCKHHPDPSRLENGQDIHSAEEQAMPSGGFQAGPDWLQILSLRHVDIWVRFPEGSNRRKGERIWFITRISPASETPQTLCKLQAGRASPTAPAITEKPWVLFLSSSRQSLGRCSRPCRLLSMRLVKGPGYFHLVVPPSMP